MWVDRLATMFKELGWKPSSLIAFLVLVTFIAVVMYLSEEGCKDGGRGVWIWVGSYLGTSQMETVWEKMDQGSKSLAEGAMFKEKGVLEGFWREETEGYRNLMFP